MRSPHLFLLAALLTCSQCQNRQADGVGTSVAETREAARGEENLAYQWAALALQATANDTERFNPRPTITSRYLGLIFVAMFDAWSRYDDRAQPVFLEGVDRRPAEERRLEQKEIAISYAAYGALREYYFSDSLLFRRFMVELGLDPEATSLRPDNPVGIGRRAARAVIEARRGDGANQYGEEAGSQGRPYFDYTGYQPVNSPDNNVDLQRWQPKYFSDDRGGRYAPGCLTPYWQYVQPIALQSADQFRPGPPPAVGSDQLAREVKEVVDLQAHLTPRQKALVEFMRDGPQSVQQAGHWLLFAQDVSRRDRHTLDEDVKMYFLVELAAMDAFIACWDAKMYYDFARPFALVHDQYQDEVIRAWGGPERGMVDMPGQQWRPYSPATFLCPPFPSYPSGHSTISSACAEVLRLFTGKDDFGTSVRLVPGAMTEPDRLGDTVTLHFPTFTETANMAGKSRVLGGYHIEADNAAGLQLGRAVARAVWSFYQRQVEGDHVLSLQ